MITSRKTKIRYIQVFLLLVAIVLFFYTYKNQITNKSTETENILSKNNSVEKNESFDPKQNKFEFVEYSGKNKTGNNFIINADTAETNAQKSEIVNLEKVTAKFYLKSGVLKITSNYGVYNNITFDIFFIENIVANMNERVITADNLDYLNSKNIMNVYGNIKANGIEGTVEADRADIDLIKNSLNLSMLNEEQVKVKLN